MVRFSKSKKRSLGAKLGLALVTGFAILKGTLRILHPWLDSLPEGERGVMVALAFFVFLGGVTALGIFILSRGASDA